MAHQYPQGLTRACSLAWAGGEGRRRPLNPLDRAQAKHLPTTFRGLRREITGDSNGSSSNNNNVVDTTQGVLVCV